MPLPADFPDQHIQEDCAGSHPGSSRAGMLHEVVGQSIVLFTAARYCRVIVLDVCRLHGVIEPLFLVSECCIVSQCH